MRVLLRYSELCFLPFLGSIYKPHPVYNKHTKQIKSRTNKHRLCAPIQPNQLTSNHSRPRASQLFAEGYVFTSFIHPLLPFLSFTSLTFVLLSLSVLWVTKSPSRPFFLLPLLPLTVFHFLFIILSVLHLSTASTHSPVFTGSSTHPFCRPTVATAVT